MKQTILTNKPLPTYKEKDKTYEDYIKSELENEQ